MRPEKVFENIVSLMRFSGNITNIAENGDISTITTDAIYSLQNGMLVEIENSTYQISDLTRTGLSEWTFNITASGLTSVIWQLAIYYEFGRALEVGNTLRDKTGDPANKNKRFPMIWLLTDIEKNYDTVETAEYEANIIIGLVYISEANLKANKRVTDKFEPILDPLAELFKEKMESSRYFVIGFGERLEIRQTDKFKYGSVGGDKHIFNDITDAIEFNMNLKFRKESNCLIST